MLIIFDFDGTLIDPAQGVIKSIDYTLDTLNLGFLDEKTKKSFIGPPIYNSLKNTFNLSDEEAKKATEIFRNIYKEKFLYEAQVYDDIPRLLQTLKAYNHQLAIATYKRQDYAELILKYFHLDAYFDFIKGADFKGKLNKKDIIRLCLEKFNTNEAVMIGDTTHDEKGAKELNIDFISVSWGYGFKKGEADVNHVLEILEKVKEIRERIVK
ncbi:MULTISPECIES: HAD-IA family hydrolase [Campylobacter]|uniref:HAD-IA family hydrolase n=1 Tax=Campylobacter TaxID=194 RepID=UPI0002589567|nr:MULTISPECIES: HAD-IA family hydrolase [Campylobacter]EAI2862856.1 HAD family hydrolase [Campylobacter jejuni]EAK1145212.1 HAD family hydrolase [Campylobacter jejuni]EAL9887179.1 HAD family hydrolase [Campylobacter jejuni]EBD1688789.1 HAD family hydrolase [Campylobacter jejuni]ECL6397471.1 HAD-IA family hydrolase [Campylobacter jejuni]